jgi:putative oxidoreductase
MKIASPLARVLLGLIFLTFGLNGFLHFIPMAPPSGLAGQYLGALFGSHYWVAVFALQTVGGAILLINRFVPLGLALLAPVVANIFLFHLCLDPRGLPLALVVILLWIAAFLGARRAFAGLLAART